MNIISSNVTVMVGNMDRAVNFYQGLGLRLINRWDDHYAMLSAKDIVIGLHPAGEEGKTGSGTTSIGFMIEDIEEAAALLKAVGVEAHREDGKSGSYLHFTDPDGTLLYFVKPGW